MTDLPAGTVTFLFSDIEGSTRLLQQLGTRYAEALGTHQQLLRAAFAAHHGQEVDTQGDSFFVAFATAGDALSAAAEVQRSLLRQAWPEGASLRVRIGLHTGAPLLTGSRYVGLDVHRAARIAAAGHGGQVLLSQATRDLSTGELPPGAHLRDLGEHRLKDLQRPEHLYQLLLPDLPGDFPPLKSLDSTRHNLPVQLTPLIGRDEAVAEVVGLLRRDGVRLVTLTGSGGIGKTRLALQVAAELIDAFADGIYLTALDAITDSELVISTIAQTLGLREAGNAPPEETLKTYLADKRALLVLDNFEQVIGAGPYLVDLLVACSGVKVLVTSRVSLHLRGEYEFEVPALGLPIHHAARPPARATDAELAGLTQYAAVALFIERARAVKHDFAVTSINAPAIAEICARVDGLPLAIELAAARVRLLPAPALLARLSSRLTLLTGGARDLPARQQTLRNTIAWSYDLLTPGEQALFRRLAVFAGGCGFEAAEAVCAAPSGAAPLPLDVLDGLDSLVAKSLLRQGETRDDAEPRFQMLETIREYGLEQLRASGEAAAVHAAHQEYFIVLAEQAMGHYRGPQELEWFATLEREHDNFRAALLWAREQADAPSGLRLAGALAFFWMRHGYLSEGREWLEGLLALARDAAEGAPDAAAPALVRARALYGAGDLAVWQGDYQHAIARLEQSLSLARAEGELGLAADALNRLGIARLCQGETESATRSWEESLAVARELGDLERALGPLNNLGGAAYIEGDFERAAACYEEALAYGRAVGDPRMYVMVGNLGDVARRQGNLVKAEALYRESLETACEHGDPRSIAECLDGLVMIFSAAGDWMRTARLFGAATIVRDTIGAPMPPNEKAELEASLEPARAALGEEAWAAAFAEGRLLTLEQAVHEALGTRT